MSIYEDRFISELSQQIAEHINWQLAQGEIPKESVEGAAKNSQVCADEQAYEYSASRYGIGYDSLDIECVIDEEGAAEIWRKVVVRAYSQVDKLHTYLLVEEKSPTGEEREIEHGGLKSLTQGVNVSWANHHADGRLSGEIEIIPPLFKDEVVTYEMSENLPKGLFAINLPNETLKKRQERMDYVSWTIIRPTRKLSLKVYFPEGIRPEVYHAEVRYSAASGRPIGRLQHEEQKHLRDQVVAKSQGRRFVLELEIDYPMTGLVYDVRWLPVPATENIDPEQSVETAEIKTKQDDLSNLRKILTVRFNESELRNLYFELGVDYDSLPGVGNIDKARELVAYYMRRDQISKLIAAGKKQRPDISWPEQLT
jgi:hypothetical protein